MAFHPIGSGMGPRKHRRGLSLGIFSKSDEQRKHRRQPPTKRLVSLWFAGGSFQHLAHLAKTRDQVIWCYINSTGYAHRPRANV